MGYILMIHHSYGYREEVIILKTTFHLIEMEKDDHDSEIAHGDFDYLVGHSLLLELKEMEILSDAQYYYAEKLMYQEQRKTQLCQRKEHLC